MAWQGKNYSDDIRSKQYPFHFAGIAGFVGGKFSMIFESTAYFFSHPMELLRGGGFVCLWVLAVHDSHHAVVLQKKQNSDLGHCWT